MRLVTVCLTNIPNEWSQALSGRTVVLESTFFQPKAIDPSNEVAFGYFRSQSQKAVARLNFHTGQVHVLSSMSPQASGVLWMSYSDPWLAWAQGESQSDLGAWTVKAFNTQTGRQLPVASSQLGTGGNAGQLSFPVAGPGFLAWSQPESPTSTALRVYHFDSDKSVTIDTGILSSPVIAGRRLVWGKSEGDNSKASFRFADLDTLKLLATPAALAKPRPMAYLAGSPDFLVWTENATTLLSYEFTTGKLSQYSFGSDALNHQFQFPVVAGRFLLWFTGTKNTVLDLVTGNAFDIDLPSGVAGAANQIVIAKIEGTKSGASRTSVSSISLDSNATIRSCSH